jgi:hypothetical protein
MTRPLHMSRLKTVRVVTTHPSQLLHNVAREMPSHTKCTIGSAERRPREVSADHFGIGRDASLDRLGLDHGSGWGRGASGNAR